jgi:hypothetical protein
MQGTDERAFLDYQSARRCRSAGLGLILRHTGSVIACVLQTAVPELEDLERLKAAIAQPNPEAVKAIERLEIRRGRVLMGYPPGGRRPPPCPSADRRPSPAT